MIANLKSPKKEKKKKKKKNNMKRRIVKNTLDRSFDSEME